MFLQVLGIPSYSKVKTQEEIRFKFYDEHFGLVSRIFGRNRESKEGE